ncbi:PREDICTED: uncharacterized protein LOC104608033 [Nelumbo nucifera]|uniref:Wall-associated receptor kinase galacturonan-binding domain-containing protein n=2 Tax=Nelumbo nucifera TaxID=4432 RepID=A0A822YJG0_NELNU|nr:PREDICTED: uncharacterized protein LOC104608033 [Nelumbo nucifera]DAD31115.1 TPA_asm: hypothetical protein HUJ06_009966 [Nelumbo nucifera]
MKAMKMKLESSLITLLCFISLAFLPSFVSPQSCKKTCGDQLIRYPFGSGPGCGDPRFQKYITCNQQKLSMTTHTGSYPVNAIDYDNQVIYIQDPTMSTCSSTHSSKGFGLDWDAPFVFHDDNVFALLDCSTSSSPLYKSSSLFNGGNSSEIPLCDNEGAPFCSLLYSCPEISTLNLPISTCCVYTPVDLGPVFKIDLQRLQCTSYTAVYSFNGQQSNPESWNYGVALKYRFNVNNDYPRECSTCERSNGVCGYTGFFNSFICSCITGVNTTTDCYFEAYWSNGIRLNPPQIGIWLIISLVWLLIWAVRPCAFCRSVDANPKYKVN